MLTLPYFNNEVTDIQGQILCLQGSPDGPEQYAINEFLHYMQFIYVIFWLYYLYFCRYVAVMNSIFSAQRSMVVYTHANIYIYI